MAAGPGLLAQFDAPADAARIAGGADRIPVGKVAVDFVVRAAVPRTKRLRGS
jgi:hypothetical protein